MLQMNNAGEAEKCGEAEADETGMRTKALKSYDCESEIKSINNNNNNHKNNKSLRNLF